MDSSRILHLFGWDKKFFLPFRSFIREHFADKNHYFIVYGNVNEKELPVCLDTKIYNNILKNIISLSKELRRADKIILHGLFYHHLYYVLILQPWLLKKCCWVLWGGDLYAHESSVQDWRWKKNELFRYAVISRLALITTTVPGDFLLTQIWYKTKARYVQNLMYYSHVSRIFSPCCVERRDKKIRIQIGNSADPSNNHKELFDKLASLQEKNFVVFAPLSYGDESYRNDVISYGRNVLGEKFVPMTEFMSFEEYNEYMNSIDIAIFNHKRQQAMGNTIGLLSLGKKIYLRSDVTPWNYLNSLGIKVYDSKGLLDLSRLNRDDAIKNIEKCRKFFNIAELKKSWRIIFDEWRIK